MKIHLHIERVVLEGVPFSVAERSLLQATMERDLTQLLRNGGLSDEFRTVATLEYVPAGAVRVGKESGPRTLGTDIAHAVHQGLGHSGGRRPANVSRQLSAVTRHSLPGENPR